MSLIRPLITNTDDIRRMGTLTMPGGVPWFEYGRRAKAVDGSTINPSMIFDGINWRFAKGPAGGKVQQTTFNGLLEGSTRASNKTRFDSAGNLVTLGVNEFDCTYDPATLQPLGLLMEESRTNSFTNGEMQGAVVGGSLPTGFAVENNPGLTTSVVGVGTFNGQSYVDIRISGTTSGTFYQLRSSNASTGVAVSSSVTLSGKLVMVGGSTANIGNLDFRLVEPSGAFPAQTSGNLTSTIGQDVRRVVTRVMTLGGTAQPRMTLTASGSGVPIDITLRFMIWQVEAGATATSYIPTAGSTVTRARDNALTTSIGFINPVEGTFAIRMRFTSIIPLGQQIINLNDGTNTDAIRAFKSDPSSTIQGGIESAALSNPSATVSVGQDLDIVLRYKSGENAIYVNGISLGGSSFEGEIINVVQTQLQIGNRPTGDRPLNATISGILYWSKALTNSECARVRAP